MILTKLCSLIETNFPYALNYSHSTDVNINELIRDGLNQTKR